MPSYKPFHCEIDRAGDAAVLALSGELDLSAVGALDQALEGLDEVGDLVVDLSELTFIDSSGLRALLTLTTSRSESGKALRVVPGPESVQRTFELAGLLDALPFDRQGDGSSTASGSG